LSMRDISTSDICLFFVFLFISTHVKNSTTKVDTVCQAVRKAIEESANNEK